MMDMARVIDGRTRVFIMGPPNTGKSTLFNVLTGGENAVVSELPGTTRDGRSIQVDVNGRSVVLHDTAGTGGTGPEAEAARIAEASLDESDRIIWMSPDSGGKPPARLAGTAAEILEVQAMSDLHQRQGFRVSSVTGEGIGDLRGWLVSSPGGTSLSGIASYVAGSLDKALESMRSGDEAVAAVHLAEAAERLAVVLGAEELELCVQRALSRLCVGK
jgi:tRNA modification GTPase